ncbi:MAG: right-handed parallel beta-helix repeat-containing protein [Bryobacteraceae bacterium]|nr:right-handed parallel beta-helix repeat-containing protein [Bryobacteraceae bacterium]
MPTIDQLNAASAAADSDVLPISQNGILRKVTRAQLVAGLQTSLAVPQAHLVGRTDSGVGEPQVVALGSGLAVQNGVLSATPQSLDMAAFAPGGAPAGGDVVPLGQNGQNVRVSFAQFMTSLPQVAGVDGSKLSVKPSVGSTARLLADLLSDAVTVESFGAIGDGITDDTAAFEAAANSGYPIRLGPKTYVVNGQWTVTQANTALLGVPGLSVMRRMSQSGGSWIAIQADGFRADGVIFDANKASITQESWGVEVGSECFCSDFHRCSFLNAEGAVLGAGLVFLASDPSLCRHVIRDCEFSGNAAHGLWVQACTGIFVSGCRAHDNGKYGICVDFTDTTFQKKAQLIQINSNRCWNNDRGISVGNYNATNTVPAVWGNANPDAVNVLVTDNVCHDNSSYGIAGSGAGLAVQNNLVVNNGLGWTYGAGILVNVGQSSIRGNTVTGAGVYGIDGGGSLGADISGNLVSYAAIGINCGGGTNVRVHGNVLQACTGWGVVVENIEADANGQTFGIACSGLSIRGNWIDLGGTSGGGILFRDGPENVVVAENEFSGGDVGNCLQIRSDSVIVERNRWNATPRFICNPSDSAGVQQIVVPDIAESVMVTSAPGGVQAMLTTSQARTAGSLNFARVTAGGQGYTTAQVAIGGSGSGAAAKAVISNGAVVGVVVTSGGEGYGACGSQLPVTITGDGTGAQAVGYSGLPVPEERRLQVRCNCPVRFSRGGSWPVQENASGADLVVPANASVTWRGTWNTWRSDS